MWIYRGVKGCIFFFSLQCLDIWGDFSNITDLTGGFVLDNFKELEVIHKIVDNIRQLWIS